MLRSCLPDLCTELRRNVPALAFMQFHETDVFIKSAPLNTRMQHCARLQWRTVKPVPMGKRAGPCAPAMGEEVGPSCACLPLHRLHAGCPPWSAPRTPPFSPPEQ